MALFKDRTEAGKRLAERLPKIKDGVVAAIPRGGMVIGYEIARKLKAPLTIIVTKKIPAPGNEELAIGAVGPSNIVSYHEELIIQLNIPKSYLDAEVKRIKKLVEDKYRMYKTVPNFKGKMVILTDDGIATGETMLTAIRVAKRLGAKKVIVAAPVASRESLSLLQKETEVICLETPENFYAIGQFYTDFRQVEDKEAIAYLERNKQEMKE